MFIFEFEYVLDDINYNQLVYADDSIQAQNIFNSWIKKNLGTSVVLIKYTKYNLDEYFKRNLR